MDAAGIALLVPHHGAMCLLDRLMAWNASSIRCETDRHRDSTNPLRRDGLLPAVCGLEFALQATALHGALRAGAAQSIGFVSSLRDAQFDVARLDDIAGTLSIDAIAEVMERSGFIYRFTIGAAGTTLLSGRAAVMLA